jgi:hypothetical protein
MSGMPDFKSILGISDDFAEASEHKANCRCDKCLMWWATMPPGEDGETGPFTLSELQAYRDTHNGD